MTYLRFRLIILEIILIIVLGSGTAYPFMTLVERFSGHITPTIHGDTLVIDYHVYSRRNAYGSIAFRLGGEEENDSHRSGQQSSWLRFDPITDDTTNRYYGHEWCGQLRLPGFDRDIPRSYSLRLYEPANESLSSDADYSGIGFVRYPTGVYGVRLDIGIASSTNSGFPEPVHSTTKNLVLRLEDRRGYYNRYYTIFAGYSINYSKKFRLYDIGRLEAEGIFWGRDRWMPIFHVAASFSSVKGVENAVKFVKRGFGGEVGVRFDGRFESFRYSYTTAAGGYHRADIILAGVSHFGDKKIGTMYTVYRGKYVRMLALSVYMEGWGESDDETLQYHNNRLFIHQVLAVISWLPLLPLGLAAME